MKLQEIEERVGGLDALEGMDFLYGLLAAYELPKASISRLRSGTYNKAEVDEERLWKSKVWFRDASGLEDDGLYPLIDAASADTKIKGLNPRFLIVRNETRLLAKDTKTGATLDISLNELVANAGFFLPWAGIEKTRLENVNVADVKAAEKMAKLYDEIIRHNEIEDQEAVHDLNVFFSRLLFCFFAEDTGVFEEGSFTNAVGSMTQESGADTAEFLDRLFALLDSEPAQRGDAPSELSGFGYVNGKLFERRSAVPRFTARARTIVLECGTLDWSQINPDIFGSMIQAVVHPSQRAGLGMHYTSVENIMKVIRPLFLEGLEDALAKASAVEMPSDVLIGGDLEQEAANTKAVRRLERFIDRLAAIQVFDPACGSGNFLVIAYKELRRLEHLALQRIGDLAPHRRGLFTYSRIELDSFAGIEVDDFAHEVAILSLWLAKHQMNIEFRELFGAEIPLIPLVDAGKILCANATRIEWEEVCDPNERETYVCGNPPYQGARVQSAQQKADFTSISGLVGRSGDLDYVAIWLMKAAAFVAKSGASAGLVATSSICQGGQVALLWPAIFQAGAEISFAVQPFRWNNHAKRAAAVTCVVVGLAPPNTSPKFLYSASGRLSCQLITPYLTPGERATIVEKRRTPIAKVPPLVFGSMPNDGGALILSDSERNALVADHPEAEDLTRLFLGSSELISGRQRWALWIEDDQVSQARAIPPIAERLERVRAHRLRSKRPATNALASAPHRMGEVRHVDAPAVAVPAISSETREYIPMAYLDAQTVASNKIFVAYGAEPWVFGLLQSRMHMVWTRAVAGRLESRINYSNTIVYNTFPAPTFDDERRAELSELAIGILGAREQFADRNLAELYDAQTMPPVLRQAHAALDQSMDSFYSARTFASDGERLTGLFKMYEAAVETRFHS